jgi:hypothetical protein
VKSQIVLGATALTVCALATVATPDANAGAASPNAKSKLSFPINFDGFGAQLPADVKRASDLATFKQIQTVLQLGPLFNGTTCAGCHSQPSMGGGNLIIREIKVRNDPDSSPVQVFAVDKRLFPGAGPLQSNQFHFLSSLRGGHPMDLVGTFSINLFREFRRTFQIAEPADPCGKGPAGCVQVRIGCHLHDCFRDLRYARIRR